MKNDKAIDLCRILGFVGFGHNPKGFKSELTG